MKILFLSLLISTTAWSMDFNKVTGSFDAGKETKKNIEVAQAQDMTFDASDSSRLPAAVIEKKRSEGPHVTEMTGSFRD